MDTPCKTRDCDLVVGGSGALGQNQPKGTFAALMPYHTQQRNHGGRPDLAACVIDGVCRWR